MPPLFDTTSKAGTVSGTLLILLANISGEDLVRTVLLAGIGAVVSFVVTLVLKLLARWLRQRPGR